MAASMLLTTFCLLCLACVASAQNNTSAAEHVGQEVGWQDSPVRRGTLDILLSCATTIFACTWSIQHLNVPGEDDTVWTNLRRSAKWMIITALLPEFILAHAVFELDMALKAQRVVNADTSALRSKLYKYLKSVLCKIVKFCKCGKDEPKDLPPGSAVQPHKWTLTHCYFANMGGLYYRDGIIQFPLTAFQYAKHRDALTLPDDLTEDYIKDKSKQDAFAKIFALFQISYLILSIGVRRFRGLLYTQLEVVTLGFAVCGMATYLFYWYKPQNVKVASKVTPKPNADPTGKPSSFQPDQESFWVILTNRKTNKEKVVVQRIRNDNIHQKPSENTHAMLPALSVISVAFNCIHLLAWKAEFPSQTESILWQTSLLCSIIIPAVELAILLLSQVTLSAGNSRRFALDCNRVLQQVAWYHPDQSHLMDAQDALERAFHSDTTEKERNIHFSTIFPGEVGAAALGSASHGQSDGSEPPKKGPSGDNPPEETPSLNLRERALAIANKDATPLELAKDFPKNFQRLVNHLEGRATKRLMENATTFVFPRRSLVPNSLNLAFLYTTGTLYAVSRLMILALALSSLRALPEGAYVTTWTKYVPSFH